MSSAEDVFPVLLVVVTCVGILVAIWSAAGMGRLYEQIGKGGLDVPFRAPSPPPGTPEAAAERNAEIRQLLDAIGGRRRRSDQPE
jgi:hypothetical protein